MQPSITLGSKVHDLPVAAEFPLADVAKAMTLAESRTVRGKVVLVP
jgi:hypothetical protein